MYDIPSNYKIAKCTITKECVEGKAEPELVIDENKKKEPIKVQKKAKTGNKKNQETA